MIYSTQLTFDLTTAFSPESTWIFSEIPTLLKENDPHSLYLSLWIQISINQEEVYFLKFKEYTAFFDVNTQTFRYIIPTQKQCIAICHKSKANHEWDLPPINQYMTNIRDQYFITRKNENSGPDLFVKRW